MKSKYLVIFLICTLFPFSIFATESKESLVFNSCMQSCYKKSDRLQNFLSAVSFAGLIAAVATGHGSNTGNSKIVDHTGFERYQTDPRYKLCHSSCKNSNSSLDSVGDGEFHPRYNNSLYEYINRNKNIYKY
ncbi:hypothetical protein [Leptospira sp. GIMC2001]|uniref:hypothetical protein n=1 Tax=Leptospira sp. GIMC2001 TaxID=1513297 RepID=UPI00234B087E|nr:hypothetical protein [Leptospira sp. GIMC2001]WCL50345.1 hypothetical protein O4O04_05880 [Leptospira sp. GIMC2001]